MGSDRMERERTTPERTASDETASDQTAFGAGTLAALDGHVIGRRREAELIVAGLMAARHLLLEGPPGTGKSTLLRAIAHTSARGFVFVEGNAELTPARLVGHFDPSRVLEAGYDPAVWIDGPLLEAMRSGALLYLEEINRIPEDTLNVLVTVMSEGGLHVPRLGTATAHPGFRLVAAMNPFDAVGTARISAAIYDRVCRVAMDYQSYEDEAQIVDAATRSRDIRLDLDFLGRVTSMVRATRTHPELRVGSSVRGAIDLVLLADQLALLRSIDPTDLELGLDAALASLSGRIRLNESSNTTPEAIVTDLWWAHLRIRPDGEDPASDGQGNGQHSGKGPRRDPAAPSALR